MFHPWLTMRLVFLNLIVYTSGNPRATVGGNTAACSLAGELMKSRRKAAVMTHQEKVACFEQLLKDRGYWKSNAIPPACRLLWFLGFKTPPPYFLSFPIGFLSAALPFAILSGTFMWVFVWQDDKSVAYAITTATLTSLFVGLAMAAFWRSQSKTLRLPAWQDFPQLPISEV